jgi:hypothetical protein
MLWWMGMGSIVPMWELDNDVEKCQYLSIMNRVPSIGYPKDFIIANEQACSIKVFVKLCGTNVK